MRPLVSRGKGRDGEFRASWRVAPADAWAFPSLELRAANSWSVLVFDCDQARGTEAVIEALVDRRAPPPNWMVTRRPAGGTHVVYCLASPVHRGAEARARPLRLLGRVSEFLGEVLEADRGYAQVLSHNPMARPQGPNLSTTWSRREPYELREIAEVIPLGWRRPRVSRTAIGRNCELFYGLMRWAGSPKNLGNDVLAAAVVANQVFDVPLDHGEVAGIARSVERYRRGWIAQGRFFAEEEKSAWAADRGRRSGLARRQATAVRDGGIVQAVLEGQTFAAVARQHALDEQTVRHVVSREAPLFARSPRRPWEEAGVSRATWYRRRGS